ncbi:MAG: helix-turn-helix domain-containing protein [Pseudonocardiales bacterium]|nr:helix-turn-helix domain-containing protein [Pseudonocardiales bacterium]
MAGPTMRRRQLGRALRLLREQAGLRTEDAARELDCARSKISHMEGARNPIGKPDLDALLRLYHADKETAVALEEMRREGKQRGWWATYRLPAWLGDLVGLEADAVTERVVELELVPALLQTEDYARAVHAAGPHKVPSGEMERRVAARMQRQKRLTEPPALTLSAVISEAALRRVMAQSDVAAGQLQRLVSDAQLPNVSLLVLPFSAGVHGSMSGSYALLDFGLEVLLDVGYQEYAAGGHLVDDQDVVQLLSDLYDALRGQTLDADESLAFVMELAQQVE